MASLFLPMGKKDSTRVAKMEQDKFETLCIMHSNHKSFTSIKLTAINLPTSKLPDLGKPSGVRERRVSLSSFRSLSAARESSRESPQRMLSRSTRKTSKTSAGSTQNLHLFGHLPSKKIIGLVIVSQNQRSNLKSKFKTKTAKLLSSRSSLSSLSSLSRSRRSPRSRPRSARSRSSRSRSRRSRSPRSRSPRSRSPRSRSPRPPCTSAEIH